MHRPLPAELARKSIHVASGAVPVLYALWNSKQWVLAILGAMTLALIALEHIRRDDNPLSRLFYRVFGFMLRRAEKPGAAKLLGATHYCAAAFVCVLIFPPPAAVLALLFLALGDTAASLVGMSVGRVRIGRKTLEGMLAFWLVASAVAAAASWLAPERYPLAAGLLAAPVAALGELLIKFEDNWVIPFLSGGTIWLLMSVV